MGRLVDSTRMGKLRFRVWGENKRSWLTAEEESQQHERQRQTDEECGQAPANATLAFMITSVHGDSLFVNLETASATKKSAIAVPESNRRHFLPMLNSKKVVCGEGGVLLSISARPDNRLRSIPFAR